MKWQKIDVASQNPYSIFLGVQLEDFGEYLTNRIGSSGHLVIITHPKVAEFYVPRLMSGLEAFQVDTIIVPEGEEEKSLERLGELTSAAIRCGVDRKSIVLALGGGVIGDLAGLFASLYMRGVRLFQIPTTLLAQVDSSIGGKVAINHPNGKNLLGDFYPPLAVWTDFSTLNTLPWEEFQNGLAETIKHAIIGDPDLFDFLERHQEEIKGLQPEYIREMVSRSAAVKVKYVSEDENEQGQRMLLNFGHSFGHALETEMSYKGITHGQGVSIGIVAAAQLAKERGYIKEDYLERMIKLMNSFKLPVSVRGKSSEVLLSLMAADKKNQSGQKILILPKGIGKAVVVRDASDEEILRAWDQVIKR